MVSRYQVFCRIIAKTFFCLLLISAYTSASAAVPKEVQADILKDKIIKQVKAKSYDDALKSIDELRALGVEVPSPVITLEAQIAAKKKDYARSTRVLEGYFEKYGKSDAQYKKALAIYLKVQPLADAQVKADAAAAEAESMRQMREYEDKLIAVKKKDEEILKQCLASVKSTVTPSGKEKTFKDCSSCPQMVMIPAGSFCMGDISGSGESDEKPVHTVTLPAFAVSQTQITNAQYHHRVRAGKCNKSIGKGWGEGSHPVDYLTWDDAKNYVNWLRNKTGKHYRLLTEAEWEYAARAGSTTKYSWGDNIDCSKARYGVQGTCITEELSVAVGRYAPNNFGLYDMHGNMNEWVEDCYQNSYMGASADGHAQTSGSCEQRVLRGGGWGWKPEYLRSASRLSFEPTYTGFGFRIAQDIDSVRRQVVVPETLPDDDESDDIFEDF